MMWVMHFTLFFCGIFTFVGYSWTFGGDSDNPKLKNKEDKDFGTLHTMDKLIYWSNKDEAIYNAMKPRLEDLTRELDLIDKYIVDYESSSQRALAPENVKVPANTSAERGKIVGSSAILSHLMITRYVTIIHELKVLLTSEEYMRNEDAAFGELNINKKFEGEQQGVDDEVPEDMFPNWKDLYTSHWAFVHIHAVYGFSAEQIAKGSTQDTSNGGEMKASQCAKIGMFALNHGYYYIAIEWLELTAKLLLENPEEDHSISLDVVKSLLRNSIKTHNYRWHGYRDSDTVLNTFTSYVNEIEPSSERVRGREYFQAHFAGKIGNKTQRHSNFLRLCDPSDIDFQPLEVKWSLKCYLERKQHPYFTLNPVKTEEISKYPYVIQMYDVLGDDTIAELNSDLSSGNFKLVGSDSLELLLAKMRHRTSSSLPLPNENFIDKLNKKSEMLTGLRVLQEQDEDLQATEYTYGRFYTQHLSPGFPCFLSKWLKFSSFRDTFPPKVLETLDPSLRKPGIGNRLATVLYYIQEPDLGGITPFCDIGTSIKSKRGSAIFWINLYRNGTSRTDVTHGACPVLSGNKIIINRWIAYDSNFQNFKCSLNQFE